MVYWSTYSEERKFNLTLVSHMRNYVHEGEDWIFSEHY